MNDNNNTPETTGLDASQLEGQLTIQLLEKMPEIQGSINKYVKKALASGAVDLVALSKQGNYRALMHILSATFGQMAEDFQPPHPTKADLANIKNIKMFL